MRQGTDTQTDTDTCDQYTYRVIYDSHAECKNTISFKTYSTQ